MPRTWRDAALVVLGWIGVATKEERLDARLSVLLRAAVQALPCCTDQQIAGGILRLKVSERLV